MDEDLFWLMRSKSTDDLKKYVTDNGRYTPDAIFAAVYELQRRGITVPTPTMQKIVSDIKQQEEKERKWENIVDDPSAPCIYSRLAIALNTTIFSVLMGVILLSVNTFKHGKRESLPMLFLFAVVYLACTIGVINFLQPSIFFTITIMLCANCFGAFIIDQHFWTACLGDDIAYRARNVDLLLLICIAILWIELLSYLFHGKLILI